MNKKDLDWLSNHKPFGSFLKTIRDYREAEIAAMMKADTAELQKIAGRILAFDEVLRMCNAHEVIHRTDSMPSA